VISDENLAQLRALIETILDERGIKKVPQDITEKRRAAALSRWAKEREACKSNANASADDTHKLNGSHAIALQVHKQKKPSKRKQEFVFPEWLEPDRDVWDAWIDARKKIKKPATDWAMTLAVARLEEMRKDGHNVRRLLADAAFNNWQDFYPKDH
jgi:hypothetical protein